MRTKLALIIPTILFSLVTTQLFAFNCQINIYKLEKQKTGYLKPAKETLVTSLRYGIPNGTALRGIFPGLPIRINNKTKLQYNVFALALKNGQAVKGYQKLMLFVFKSVKINRQTHAQIILGAGINAQGKLQYTRKKHWFPFGKYSYMAKLACSAQQVAVTRKLASQQKTALKKTGASAPIQTLKDYGYDF